MAGPGLGGAGLALLALTLPSIDGSHSALCPRPRSLAFEGGLGCSPSASPGPRAAAPPARRGVLLAVLAGILFAFAGVAIKALTGGGRPVAPRPGALDRR